MESGIEWRGIRFYLCKLSELDCIIRDRYTIRYFMRHNEECILVKSMFLNFYFILFFSANFCITIKMIKILFSVL